MIGAQRVLGPMLLKPPRRRGAALHAAASVCRLERVDAAFASRVSSPLAGMKASNARPGGPSSDLPPLLRAVQSQDPAAVEKILGTMHNDHQLEQARAPRTQNTALHLAAAQGSLQILKLLIPVYTQHAFGARKNLNAQNANRDTPLLFACARGHAGAAAMLIKAGASVDFFNDGKMTPLIAAASSGHHTCVELLLRHGAEKTIDAEDAFGRRALHFAAATGNVESVKLLLDTGADVFARDRNGNLPRDAAMEVQEGNNACLGLLDDAMREREDASSAATRDLLVSSGNEAGSEAELVASIKGSSSAKSKNKKKKKKAAGSDPSSPLGPVQEGETDEGLSVNAEWAKYFANGGDKVDSDVSKVKANTESRTETNEVDSGYETGDEGRDDREQEQAEAADLQSSQPAELKTQIAPRSIYHEPTPPRSWASIAIGEDVRKAPQPVRPVERSKGRDRPRRPNPGAIVQPVPPPPAPEPSKEKMSAVWVSEATARLAEKHPTAVALELEAKHVLGIGIDDLSYSQLEACEEVHRELLSSLADARINLVREQERTRAAELAEIERLRAALAEAHGIRE